MLVDLVEVAAGRVRLPDLDQSRPHRVPRGVGHLPRHDDPLAERLSVVLPGEVVVELADRLVAVRGPGELRERVGQDQERALGRAQLRGAVVRIQVRRVIRVEPVANDPQLLLGRARHEMTVC